MWCRPGLLPGRQGFRFPRGSRRRYVLMSWTDERVETLCTHWSEGLRASQIAAQLGGVSRNAVIGKVHRLKLSGRGRAASAAVRPKKTVQAVAGSGVKQQAPRMTRTVTASIGATALQVQFDNEPVARQ